MRSLSDTLERLARFRKDKSGTPLPQGRGCLGCNGSVQIPELCKLGTMFLSA